MKTAGGLGQGVARYNMKAPGTALVKSVGCRRHFTRVQCLGAISATHSGNSCHSGGSL